VSGVTASAGQALVFTSPMGTPLRHSNFYRRVWMPAVAKVGLPGIHFHDLRHAGNTLTADAGASLRELMDRMGHSSTRAVLIYLVSRPTNVSGCSLRPSARLPARHFARQGRHLARKWHEAQVRCHETARARQNSNPRPAA